MIIFYKNYLNEIENPDSEAIKHILTVIDNTIRKFEQYDIDDKTYHKLMIEKNFPILLLLLSHQRNTKIIDELMKRAKRSGDQSIVDILKIIQQYSHPDHDKHDSLILIEEIDYEDEDKKENALKALEEAGLPMYLFTSNERI